MQSDSTDIQSANKETVNKETLYASALDNMLTAIMMVDRDFNVTYVNKATIDLLDKHQSSFQKLWPEFQATENYLMGRCIDGFHKQPSHQRQILSDPSNLPIRTDIKVDDLVIELNVSAMTDASGEYIGNTLEWYDVTETRAREAEIGRLSSAANGMTVNLMMANEEGVIVYVNPSLEKMLSRREAAIRKVLPSFDMRTLVGSNIDIFHQNPAYQRAMLADMSNFPLNTNIRVADLHFNLTAIELKDSAGKNLGTAVQWMDETDEKGAQTQIEAMISTATQGDLSSRIETGQYEGFSRSVGEGINGLMDAIVSPVNEAMAVVKGLAKGDISQSMAGTYSGQFAELSSAINESMDNLRSMVQEIRSASNNVFSAAREIAQGNDDLSQRTESQASNLEETASAMEELTSTVQGNARAATEATEKANGAMSKASNGGEVVKNAVTAMEEITKSSKKIADIIGVIDEIAFQTNLLALNAAVEAARAGEQGRGFAVVAAEVRNLAQRSASAAKEIKELINDSVDAVEKGTRLVDDTGATFGELVSAVQEVVSMVSSIDSASREQSSGIVEVSKAVSQMDEMTQQNAALVEQASASSKAMEEQAQSLLQQISFFRLADEQRAAPAVASGGHAASGPAAPARSKPSRSVPVDEEWEDF
ncbi:methyl-accepting chemotaxis protein [Halioxenophilus aromaticivorans]|uniref:Methyl-accepting chemotaxis protein n=1 Tax=Halioxenophilus aromaticivorans TaxID=1306992 RepID=A0AAV3U1Q9_9ALTE